MTSADPAIPPVHHSLRQRYLRHRYRWLFVCLVITLGFGPLLQILGFRTDILDFLVAGSLALGVTDTRTGRRSVLLLSLTTLFAVGVLASRIPQFGAILVWTRGMGFVLMVWVALAILRRVLRPGHVDAERLFASLCVYLLVGLAFGLLYAAIDAFHPGSMRDTMGTAGNPISPDRAIYFSVITLTTLGYGDVVPGSDVTAAVAMIEAIIGQAYTTVLVAWLVSLYVRDYDSKRT